MEDHAHEHNHEHEHEQIHMVSLSVEKKPKAGEELDVQLSCSSICPFSNQKNKKLDVADRLKSSSKLRMLIIFSTMVMVVEIIGGIRSNSLAVLTDAVHLLSDIAGFSISLFTVWVSGWEATPRQSFGFNRLEVLGALLSIQLIWVISGILIYEAIERLLHQTEKINGKLMFIIAAFGCLINFIMVIWLGHDHSHHSHHAHSCSDHDHDHGHGHEHEHEMKVLEDIEESTSLVSATPNGKEIWNINIQGAYLHVVTDLIQSVGVMIAGCIIWFKPDWLVVDLVCTLFFSMFALSATLPMLKKTFGILMERTPSEIDLVKLENGIKDVKGVVNVQDLHVWAITAGKFVLVCHVESEAGVNPNQILHNIRELCENRFRIHHVTVQIE